MARIKVTAAIQPAYQHMVRMLFRPFNLKKWLALGFVSLLAGSAGGGPGGRFPCGSSEPNTREIDQALQWMAAHWGIIAAAGAIFVILLFVLYWLGSIFRLVYTEQVAKDSYAIKEPFARLKSLGTSLFLWLAGFGFAFIAAAGILVGLPVGLAFGLNAAGWVQVVAAAWGVIAFLAILLIFIIVNIFAIELVSGVMYTRGVRVLEAWRLLLPRLKENIGQTALYLLLIFAFCIGLAILSIFAAFIVLMVMLIPFGGVFLLAALIGKSAGLVWNAATISIAAFYGAIFFAAYIYVFSCVLQPAVVFLRAFSLAVLGQMDESFATVPTGLEPLLQNEQ